MLELSTFHWKPWSPCILVTEVENSGHPAYWSQKLQTLVTLHTGHRGCKLWSPCILVTKVKNICPNATVLLNSRNSSTDLNHMFLHAGRIVTSKNWQQLVIRDEEKSRKRISLGVQIIIQTFLTFLQSIHQTLHCFQSSGRVTRVQDFRILCCFIHDLGKWKSKVISKELQHWFNL
jgi:hypothetical protein